MKHKITSNLELQAYKNSKVILRRYPEKKLLPIYANQVGQIVQSDQSDKVVFYFGIFEQKGKTTMKRNQMPFTRFSPSYPLTIQTFNYE